MIGHLTGLLLFFRLIGGVLYLVMQFQSIRRLQREFVFRPLEEGVAVGIGHHQAPSTNAPYAFRKRIRRMLRPSCCGRDGI